MWYVIEIFVDDGWKHNVPHDIKLNIKGRKKWMNVHKLFRKARGLKQIWACESCLLRMLNGFNVLILNAMWTKAWTLSFELVWDFYFYFYFWILIWRYANLSSSCGFYVLFRFMDAYVIYWISSVVRLENKNFYIFIIL